MPPLDRRRRARRSNLATWIPAVLVGVLVASLLVGGVLGVHRASGAARRTVDRSFATGAAVVVDGSNVEGSRLNQLLQSMPAMDRQTLELSLDQLVAASAAQSSSAATLARGKTPAGVDQALAHVMATRAAAAAALRRSVDRLLSMSPWPVAGAPATAARTGPPISTAEATAELSAVDAELAGADADYAALRHRLWLAGGSGRLPPSVWVADPHLWESGPLATLVDEIATSPTLAPDHHLGITTVRVDPAAVPPANGPPPVPPGLPSISVLPPTSAIDVTAVVSNAGNLDETGVVVSTTLAPVGAPATGSTTESAQRVLDLAAASSQVVAFRPLAARPGTDYLLTVAISAPPSQADRSALVRSYGLRVSPAA
ncbi:MAG TPA: hypothetical protein VKG43_01000 [Acidimicrobiales bacterium]|nr:hypothetical protein [Acidimicrobiales bacterium]